MGLFDKLGGTKEIVLSKQSALLLSAMTMIGIDGDIDDDEVAIIQRMNRENPSGDDWENALKTWRKKSISESIEIVANILEKEDQITAVANLVDIAMADGILDGDEKILLEAYIEKFDVSSSVVESIVDVVFMKNKKLF
jgi:tellurite resistance protein